MIKVSQKRPDTKHLYFRDRRNNQKLRELTLQRDNYTCNMCLNPYPEYKLECDHTVPLQQGGADDMSNTQCLCLDCHRLKTNSENNYKQG